MKQGTSAVRYFAPVCVLAIQDLGGKAVRCLMYAVEHPCGAVNCMKHQTRIHSARCQQLSNPPISSTPRSLPNIVVEQMKRRSPSEDLSESEYLSSLPNSPAFKRPKTPVYARNQADKTPDSSPVSVYLHPLGADSSNSYTATKLESRNDLASGETDLEFDDESERLALAFDIDPPAEEMNSLPLSPEDTAIDGLQTNSSTYPITEYA
jgi:hypothetical protein